MPVASPHISHSVAAIRDASRRIVRELGFMQPTLAGTALPPSAVHALIELGTHDEVAGTGAGSTAGLTATDLAERLNLEKSSVSRMLRKRIEAGEIAESPSARDGRAKTLALTAKGKAAFTAIDAFGEGQVAAAFRHLDADEQRTVAAGLSLYARALGAVRAGKDAAPRRASCARAPLDIVAGYRPGVVGRIAEMHARHYARTMNFGQAFESKVASGAADFVSRLDSPRNSLWIALEGERIVGTVAIDGEDLGDGTAHLRWFIVDEAARGTGTGRRLLGEAIAFCDGVGFEKTALWTIHGLEAARHLYEDAGFVLAEEWSGDQWGREVREQKYLRQRP